MRMNSAVCGVVLMAAACCGCLRKEVTQTIYLAPSGVVWSAIERDVRSDEKAPADRIREEHDYFLAASAGRLVSSMCGGGRSSFDEFITQSQLSARPV